MQQASFTMFILGTAHIAQHIRDIHINISMLLK